MIFATVTAVFAVFIIRFAYVARHMVADSGAYLIVPCNDEVALVNNSENRSHQIIPTVMNQSDQLAAKSAGVELSVDGHHSTERDFIALHSLNSLSLSPPAGTAVEMNDWMDRTLAGDALPLDFGGTLAALFRDRSNNELTRNFAVQHLEQYASALERRGSFAPDSVEAKDIRAALHEASRETTSHIAGSAILGLERLSRIDQLVDRAALSSLAASYAADASINLPTRIAAVQLCGSLRVFSSAVTLRAITADPSSNTALKLAATHSLSLFAE